MIVHLNKNETDFLYREIFEQQSYFQNGITLNEGDCIFDVGANIDLFTLGAKSYYDDIGIIPAPGAMGVLAVSAGLFLRRRRA